MNNQHFETSKDSFNNHRIWIDVGAHMGQNTLQPARENPNIKVYAFEPNLKLAVQLFGVLPNYVVIPAAISTQDGFSDFYLNDDDATSSLKAFNPEGVSQWICGEQLKKNAVIIAPTVRLDTFLASMGIERVDYLKIDAQGSDFDVILSAGERIKDISKIKLEVAITPKQLYLNAHTRAEVIDYLSRYNFILVHREKQSFDQEENLTFIRRDILQNSSQLFQYRQLESLEIENILKVAEAIAITRSLEPYPKWHFNVEWNSPDLSTQLRRSIWEYFKTKQIEARIKLNWYHNLQLYLYL
jgi:FkbM family methyltransferase